MTNKRKERERWRAHERERNNDQPLLSSPIPLLRTLLPRRKQEEDEEQQEQQKRLTIIFSTIPLVSSSKSLNFEFSGTIFVVSIFG
jgi:hypothetical protein